MNGVPLLDLKEQNCALEGALQEAFSRVLHSGRFILGEELDSFEAACADYLGVDHAIGVSSGTDALLLALMALGVGPGDEVLVPDFTFFATAGCVSRLGARPVFCDVCPVCFNLDPHSLRSRISARSKAVIPVHLFGQSAPMDAILEVARTHGLAVVEDAAQAFGGTWDGSKLGGLGTFGAYSFFPSKNLGAFGDGGLLVTRDPALAQRARVLRVHGMDPKYHHPMIGGNFRMDALQAALLKVKLPFLDQYNRARAANAAFYQRALASIPGVGFPASACPGNPACCTSPQPTETSPEILLPQALPRCGHIWNQFTLRVRGPGRREALRSSLSRQGIGCEVYYPVPLQAQACFRDLLSSHQPTPCPQAATLCQEVLSLPVFPELREADLQQVAHAVASFLASA